MRKKRSNMSSLKEEVTGDPIHRRSIDMVTYALDDDTVLVEGWLRESRHHNIYDITGEEVEKGPVHHMAIRLKVGGTPITIINAEAEMVHVPLDFCHENVETIRKIIGLKISVGFQKKVRDLIGGDKGCTHLTNLLIAMSQAVFQGFLAHKQREPRPAPRTIEEVEELDVVLGRCSSWKEDGPKMKNLKAAIERKRLNS